MNRTLLLAAIALCASSFAAITPVPKSIQESFQNNYPAANRVEWNGSDSFYEVSFKSNGIVCQIRYDLSGNIVSLRRAYYEKDLAPFLAGKVKQNYPNKKIYGITEFTTKEGITYEIVLEDSNNWLIVRSDSNGEINTIKKFRKSKQ